VGGKATWWMQSGRALLSANWIGFGRNLISYRESRGRLPNKLNNGWSPLSAPRLEPGIGDLQSHFRDVGEGGGLHCLAAERPLDTLVAIANGLAETAVAFGRK
jgi:hypothetical protein